MELVTRTNGTLLYSELIPIVTRTVVALTRLIGLLNPSITPWPKLRPEGVLIDTVKNPGLIPSALFPPVCPPCLPLLPPRVLLVKVTWCPPLTPPITCKALAPGISRFNALAVRQLTRKANALCLYTMALPT